MSESTRTEVPAGYDTPVSVLSPHARDWPGVNGLAALLGGHPLHATRSRHFFSPRRPDAAAVTLNLAPPSELRPRFLTINPGPDLPGGLPRAARAAGIGA